MRQTEQHKTARTTPWAPKGDDEVVARGSADTSSALVLREVRRQVRYVASLVSTRGRIVEEMSDKWAADIVGRVIFWRPTRPWPPFDDLLGVEIRFLTVHEAGHLNFTGGWNEPAEWGIEKRLGFKRFLNGVEDIRIERLEGQDLPGFERIRKQVNRSFGLAHKDLSVEQWAPMDQVWRGWFALENGAEMYGHPTFIKFAEDTWADVSRMANADCTDDLAQALIPIFDLLWEEQPPSQGGGGDEDGEGQGSGEGGAGEGGGDQEESDGGGGSDGQEQSDRLDQAAQDFKGSGDEFSDEPSKRPYKSPLGSGQEPPTVEQLLEMIKDAAGEDARDAIRDLLDEIEEQQDNADRQKDLITGGELAGTKPSSSRPPDDSWDKMRVEMELPIRALAHKLRSVLKTNAAASWTEGTKRGRLNVRRAARAAAGDNRIFRKRTSIGAHDYVWGILPDVSGSMKSNAKDGHPKADHALRATVLLGEAFQRARYGWFVIPWEYALRTRKALYGRLVDVKDQVGADIKHATGGTYEAPALIAAQEEFIGSSSSHKILFVISDGQTGEIHESEQLIAELEEMGVYVIGIGIGIDPPKHHSVKIRVDDAGDLVHQLPRLVNEIARKGGGSW